MSAAVWAFLVTVAVSILLGCLAAKFDNQSKAIAYLVALVTASVGASVALYFEISAFGAEQSTTLARVLPTLKNPVWNSVVQDIAAYDRENQAGPLEQTLHEPLRIVISRSINQARAGLIEIPDKNDVVLTTLRLLSKAQESVRATSYISPKEWWQSDIAQSYDENLKATRQHVKTFQRLFIVGSAEEAKLLKPVMEAQEKVGVEVKFSCATSIAPDRREDFIVVDDSVAAVLVLDEQRRFRSSHFFSTKVLAEDFDRRFTNLWIGARAPSEIGKAVCASPSSQ